MNVPVCARSRVCLHVCPCVRVTEHGCVAIVHLYVCVWVSPLCVPLCVTAWGCGQRVPLCECVWVYSCVWLCAQPGSDPPSPQPECRMPAGRFRGYRGAVCV